MPVTPTSPDALALDAAKTLIATTAAFQTMTGTGSVAAAKARVYTYTPNTLATRPCAWVWLTQESQRSNRWQNGRIEVAIQRVTVTYTNVSIADFDDAYMDFLNHVGQIEQEIMDIEDGHTAGMLKVRSIESLGKAERSDIRAEGEIDDYWEKRFSINFGLE